ncbi:MAG: hypothetical protein ACR2K1_07245 [Saprospiraceae bacterium]
MFAYRSRIPELPLRALIPVLLLVLAAFFRAPDANGRPHELSAAAFLRGEEVLFRGFAQTLADLPICSLPAWLSVLSWLSAGLALWLFDLNLRLISPGARAQSRSFYSVIFVCLAPAFFQSGWSPNPDIPVLALLLGFVWCAGKAMEGRHLRHALGAAASGFAALALQPLLWPAVLCLALGLGWSLRRAGRGSGVLIALAGAISGAVVWLSGLGAAARLRAWSPANWFATSVADGAAGAWPNALFAFFPFFYPAFCLLLPLLLLLWKRTDWQRPVRRWLLIALAAYLLFLSGLPGQRLSDLLPAYILLLLSLFQSWDRLQSYGEFFLPRLTYGILAAAILVQLAANLFCEGGRA